MRCDEARQAWHQRHDDGIPIVRAEEHLRNCDACRQYHAHMNALAGLLGQLHDASERLPALSSDRARGTRRFTTYIAHAIGWAAFLALVAGPSMEWAKHAPNPEHASNSGQRLANSGEAGAAGVNPPVLRAAPEIETLGQTEAQYLVVATELPAHPQVRLYWLYPTGMGPQRETGPG